MDTEELLATPPWDDATPPRQAHDDARQAYVTAVVDYVVEAVARSREVLDSYTLTVDVDQVTIPDDGATPDVARVSLGDDHWDQAFALGHDDYGSVIGDGLTELVEDAIAALRDAGVDDHRIAVALIPAEERAAQPTGG